MCESKLSNSNNLYSKKILHIQNTQYGDFTVFTLFLNAPSEA